MNRRFPFIENKQIGTQPAGLQLHPRIQTLRNLWMTPNFQIMIKLSVFLVFREIRESQVWDETTKIFEERGNRIVRQNYCQKRVFLPEIISPERYYLQNIQSSKN